MNVLDQLCVQGKWSRSTFPPHSMTPTLLIPSLASVLNCLVSTAATAQAAAGSITSFIRSRTYNTYKKYYIGNKFTFIHTQNIYMYNYVTSLHSVEPQHCLLNLHNVEML